MRRGMEILRPEQRLMEAALEVRSARAELLAENVANAGTPGYLTRDVKFDDALTRAFEQRDGTSGAGQAEPSLENLRFDRNDVDVNRQLAGVYANSLSYVATLKLYGDSIGRLKAATASS
jgi:flagellar basal-body rod protein FlgB